MTSSTKSSLSIDPKKTLRIKNMMDDLSSQSGHGTKSSDAESGKELAHDETVAVKQTKRLVILVLVIAAALVGTLVYLLVAKGEQRNFEHDVSPLRWAGILQNQPAITHKNAHSFLFSL